MNKSLIKDRQLEIQQKPTLVDLLSPGLWLENTRLKPTTNIEQNDNDRTKVVFGIVYFNLSLKYFLYSFPHLERTYM
jgi:hypothetical protein